jgi:wee1-like protein kinase
MDFALDASSRDGLDKSRSPMDGSQKKKRSYVSQAAVALRCRVMPPPCIKNPYLNGASSHVDTFCDRRSKLSGCFTLFIEILMLS